MVRPSGDQEALPSAPSSMLSEGMGGQLAASAATVAGIPVQEPTSVSEPSSPTAQPKMRRASASIAYRNRPSELSMGLRTPNSLRGGGLGLPCPRCQRCMGLVEAAARDDRGVCAADAVALTDVDRVPEDEAHDLVISKCRPGPKGCSPQAFAEFDALWTSGRIDENSTARSLPAVEGLLDLPSITARAAARSRARLSSSRERLWASR